MSMKIITVPEEVLVYPSNYTCPHRGRIGFHGIRLDSGICFFDSKNQRNCQGPVDDPEGFPEWCPLEDYDPTDHQEKTCVNCPDKGDDMACCATLRARVRVLEAEADSCTIFVGKMEAERDTLRVEIEFLRDALKPAVRPDVHALVTKERDTLGADSRILLARAKELEDYILTKGIPDAPCPICHYNGNGYYTELMHDCVKRHKALTPAYGDQP